VAYTLEAVMDYYPYGKILREYSNGEQEKYLTTQHERDVETGLDYRGARFYDGDLGRFLSLDPLAADYPSLSAYVYVADNPLIFIDYNGKEFTPASEKYVEDLKGYVNALILSAQKGAKLYGDEHGEFQSRIDQLKEVQSELATLEKSEQLYEIRESKDTGDGNGYTTYDEDIEFNGKKGAVVAIFNGKISTMGHEAKHLFQFEKGQLSFVKVGGIVFAGASYDMGDEVEAVNRGVLLGGPKPTMNEMSVKYGLKTMSGEGVNNSTTVGEVSKQSRFKRVFSCKPKKDELKMRLDEYMKKKNEEGKRKHFFKEENQDNDEN
jgi:RHS repeat-associated protein